MCCTLPKILEPKNFRTYHKTSFYLVPFNTVRRNSHYSSIRLHSISFDGKVLCTFGLEVCLQHGKHPPGSLEQHDLKDLSRQHGCVTRNPTCVYQECRSLTSKSYWDCDPQEATSRDVMCETSYWDKSSSCCRTVVLVDRGRQVRSRGRTLTLLPEYAFYWFIRAHRLPTLVMSMSFCTASL